MGGIHMGASAAFLNGTGPRRQQRRLQPHRVEEVDRPVHRRRDRRRHAAALARARHRRHGHLGRRVRRLSVRVLQHDVVVRRQQPAAGLGQPAGHVRAHVRRSGHARAAARASADEAEHARLGHARDVAAAEGHRRERQRDPRRVPDEHPPRRGAAAEDASALRVRSRTRPTVPSVFPRTSTST